MAQTSVEWFIETMSNKHIGFKTYANANKEIIEQAKEMHKEEIKTAYDKVSMLTAEEYYNETFNK
jgi:hypothetical protein